MGFVSRLALVTAAIIALVIGGIMALAYSTGTLAMRSAQNAETRGVGLLIRNAVERASFSALAEAETIARQPGLIQAVVDRDRAAIQDLMGPTFAYLRAEAGLTIVQFHQADFRNLVRLQDPGRYGDDISRDRPLVVAAVHNRRSQRGLEIGPTGLALRGAALVMQGEALVGIAEVGLALDPLLQSVKQVSGADVAVVLSNAMTRPDGGGGDAVTVQGSTNTALFNALTAAPAFRLSREAIFLEIGVDGARYALVVEPLLDFSGRMIGSVVGAVNADTLSLAFNRDVLVMLFAGLAGIIIAFSVLWVANMAFLARPMEAMTAYAEALAAGEAAGEPPRIGGARVVRRAHAALLKLAQAAKRP